MSDELLLPFQCPKCHGYLAISAHSPYITCEYCDLKLLRTDPIIQRQLEIDADIQKRNERIADIKQRLSLAISSGDFSTQISCNRVLSRVTDDEHYPKMLHFWAILEGKEQVTQSYLSSLSKDELSEMTKVLKSLPPDFRLNNRPVATLALSKYLGIIDSQMSMELLESGITKDSEVKPDCSESTRLSEIVISELTLGRSGGLSCTDSYRKVNTTLMLTVGFILVAVFCGLAYLLWNLDVLYITLIAALGVLLNYTIWGTTRYLSRGESLYCSSCKLSGVQQSRLLVYQDGLVFEHKDDRASSEFLMFSDVKNVSSSGTILTVDINNGSSLRIELNKSDITEVQRVFSYISARSLCNRNISLEDR